MKQTVFTSSSDAGRSWAPVTVLTGYLQQTALLVRTADGVLLCVFSHKDRWPRNASSYDGWTKYGQRFIARCDDDTFSTTIKPLYSILKVHRGSSPAWTRGGPGRTPCLSCTRAGCMPPRSPCQTVRWSPRTRYSSGPAAPPPSRPCTGSRRLVRNSALAGSLLRLSRGLPRLLETPQPV